MPEQPGCPHGFPKPANCIECMDEVGLGPAPTEATDERVLAYTTAAFETECYACPDDIEKGDRIAMLSSNEWVHARCAPAQPSTWWEAS